MVKKEPSRECLSCCDDDPYRSYGQDRHADPAVLFRCFLEYHYHEAADVQAGAAEFGGVP